MSLVYRLREMSSTLGSRMDGLLECVDFKRLYRLIMSYFKNTLLLMGLHYFAAGAGDIPFWVEKYIGITKDMYMSFAPILIIVEVLVRARIKYTTNLGISNTSGDMKSYEELSAHEIGHVLVDMKMAMFAEQQSIEISAFIDTVNNNGQTRYSHYGDKVNGFEKLEMLGCVAGKVAERLISNKVADSYNDEHSDVVQFENIARNFLNTFEHDYVWFRSPKSSEELRSNSDTLKQIHLDYVTEAETFLRENKDLLFELTELLMEKGKLNSNDFQPYFKRFIMKQQ